MSRPLTATEVSVVQRLFAFGLPKKLIACALDRSPAAINAVLSRNGRPRPAYRFSPLDLRIIPLLPDSAGNVARVLGESERSVHGALSRLAKAGLVLASTAPQDLERWSIWKKCSRVCPTPLDQRVLQHLPGTLPDISAELGTAIPSVHRALRRLQSWEAVQPSTDKRASDTVEGNYKPTVVWERGPNRLDALEFAVVALLPATPMGLCEQTGATLAGVIQSLRRCQRLGIADTDGKLRSPGRRPTVWNLNERALEKRYEMDDSALSGPSGGMGHATGSAKSG